MQEMFPLELKQKFKAKIIKIEPYLKYNHIAFFQCSTNFGQMTLLIEELQTESQQIKQAQITPYEYFKTRNKFLAGQKIHNCMPVIYQQYVLKTHKDKSTCFTLIQPIQFINFYQMLQCQNDKEDNIQSSSISHQLANISQKNLIFFADQISKSDFLLQFPPQSYQLKKLIRSRMSQKLYFDFTSLNKVKKPKNLQNYQFHQQNIKQNLSSYLNVFYKNKNLENKIGEVIFLKDKIFKFSYKKLIELPLDSWTTLAIYLNLLQDFTVQYKARTQATENQRQQQSKKGKLSQIKKLNGKNIEFCFQDQIYKNLDFLDGICINALEQITYEDLVQNFFIKSTVSPANYTITKQTYVMIFACQSSYLKEKQDKVLSQSAQDNITDILIVQPEVNKLECINFFITYFKYIDPILKSISFFKEDNLLEFQFLNKLKKKRKVKIKFYEQYVIKDEQISMIIEKSKLDGTSLNLSKMSITDSFLLFLANSDKMKKIKHLDISYCQKITQNGVNSLLISPFCKKLQILNVSGAQIMDSSIESLTKKANLSQLYINDCKRLDQNLSSKIQFKNQNLQRLEAIGVNIQVFPVDSLHYLKLTDQFPIQQLKKFKNLYLIELTIRLINKKNIMNIFGNFYGKQSNPIKQFVEGNSANTLKYLDISYSTAKTKNIRSMLHMPELQTLKLNYIHKLNEIDFPISSKILSLQVQNSPLKIKDLSVMLKNTKIMSKLSIINTQIGKYQIIDFIVQNKKFINTVSLSEEQYTNKLIEKDKPILQFIETIQVSVNRLIFVQMEYMLNQMLYKVSKSNKVIRLVADSKIQLSIIRKVKKFLLTVNGFPLKNLYINSKGYHKIINMTLPQQVETQQHVIIHKPFVKPIKVYLNDQIKKFNFSQKNNSYKKLNSNQFSISSMTNFTYLYKKIVNQHPNDTYQVSVRGNKTISNSIIKMLVEYSTQQKIKSIDFRNCVFSFMNIAEYLIDIPFLNSVNNGEYELILQSETFLQMSQKYLKFFMRIKEIKKFKIIANEIIEADILFSILYHVIDQHSQTLKELEIELNGIKIIEESLSFLIRIFTLKSLKKLVLNLNQCQNYQILKQNLSHLTQAALPKLKQLRFINFPIQYLPAIKFHSLEDFQVNLQKSLISEQNLINIMKPFFSHLKTLKINFSCCDLISNLNKLVPLFKISSQIQKLILSFEYCPLKQSSLFEFIQSLSGLKKMKYFQLDVSYTINMLNELVRSISNLHQMLPQSYFKIFVINQFSKDFVFHKEQLDSQGIEIIT